MLFDVIDLELEEKIDKSGIGCYVSLGKRLLDVLVLSDIEQKLKIHLADPEDRLQVIVKFLGNDERKLGTPSLHNSSSPPRR